MIRLNVRCCCVPVKVLGTLPVFEKDAHNGARVMFPLMKPSTTDFTRHIGKQEFIAFEVRTIVNKAIVEPEMLDCTTLADLAHGVRKEIKVRDAYVKEEVFDLALKHEGITLEILRRIPGFIEATP